MKTPSKSFTCIVTPHFKCADKNLKHRKHLYAQRSPEGNTFYNNQWHTQTKGRKQFALFDFTTGSALHHASNISTKLPVSGKSLAEKNKVLRHFKTATKVENIQRSPVFQQRRICTYSGIIIVMSELTVR